MQVMSQTCDDSIFATRRTCKEVADLVRDTESEIERRQMVLNQIIITTNNEAIMIFKMTKC